MDKGLNVERVLVVLFVGILGVLGVGLLLYFFMPQKTKKNSKTTNQQTITIKEIFSRLDSSSNAHEIEGAISLFFENFENLAPSKKERFELFSRLVRHKKTSSKIIISTEKELKKRNPEDAKELEGALKMGLDSR